MMVLLDSLHSKPFVLKKLKVKALLKPLSGSRSNYNFSLKLIVTTLMFQFLPRIKRKKRGVEGGWLWALFMEKDVELSLAHKADGVVIQTKAQWVTRILLRTCLLRMQTEMVIFEDIAGGGPESWILFRAWWLNNAGNFSWTDTSMWFGGSCLISEDLNLLSFKSRIIW